jgi:hypothetical protein
MSHGRRGQGHFFGHGDFDFEETPNGPADTTDTV